jgi:hypothetical protein
MKQPIDRVNGVGRVRELAGDIRENIPRLSDLSIAQLEEIAKAVVFQRLVKKLDFEVSANCLKIY